MFYLNTVKQDEKMLNSCSQIISRKNLRLASTGTAHTIGVVSVL